MMKCKGNFKYKGISKTEAGVFKNDKGEEIKYNASYKIKVDEITDNGINERVLKFPAENDALFQKIITLKPYDDITLDFVVELTNNGCKVTPIDLIQSK